MNHSPIAMTPASQIARGAFSRSFDPVARGSISALSGVAGATGLPWLVFSVFPPVGRSVAPIAGYFGACASRGCPVERIDTPGSNTFKTLTEL